MIVSEDIWRNFNTPAAVTTTTNIYDGKFFNHSPEFRLPLGTYPTTSYLEKGTKCFAFHYDLSIVIIPIIFSS
jgi:hypothetical protein